MILGLYKEQWALWLLTLLLLLADWGYGLPSPERNELLTHGLELQVDEIRQAYSNAAVDSPKAYEISDQHKFLNFNEFLLYSSLPDEWFTYNILARMDPASLNFRPVRQVYGTAYIYPVGALIFALSQMGVLTLGDDALYYLDHPQDMARMIMAGRSLGLLSFLGMLFIVGRWGNQYLGRWASGLAMLALFLSPVVILNADVSKPHLYAGFLATICLYSLFRQHDSPRKWRLVLAAVCAGLAVGSSVTAGPLLIFIPLLLWQKDRKIWFWQSASVIAGSLLIWVLSNPYLLIDFGAFFHELKEHSGSGPWDYFNPQSGKLRIAFNSLFLYSYPFPLALFGVLGAISLWRKGQVIWQRLLLGSLLAFLVVIPTYGINRFSLFLTPILVFCMGEGLDFVCFRLLEDRKIIAGTLLTLVLLPGVLNAASIHRDAIFDKEWLKNTRQWVQKDLRGQATTVGILNRHLSPVIYPPFPFLRLKMVDLNKYKPNLKKPDFVITGTYTDTDRRWHGHPLFNEYRELYNLGRRPDWDWLADWRYSSKERVAGRVYVRKSP